jgi:hypothetical protein
MLGALPGPLVRHAAALLHAPELSDAAYQRAGSVVRTLAEVAPVHLPTLLAEMETGMVRLCSALSSVLLQAASLSPSGLGDSNSAALLGGASRQGAQMLRMLHTLQALRKQQTSAAEAARKPAEPGGAAAAAAPPAAAAAPADQPMSEAPGSEAAARPAAAAAEAPPPAEGGPAVLTLSSPACVSSLSSSIESVALSLEPLWRALSAVISSIEETMRTPPSGGPAGSGAGAPAAGAAAAAAGAREAPGPAAGGAQGAGAAAAGAAAEAPGAALVPSVGANSRVLPPGAPQVLPLVEAFFVVCNLQVRFCCLR